MRDLHIPWMRFFISNALVLLVYYADRVVVWLPKVFGWGGQFVDKWNKEVNQLAAQGEQDLHTGNYAKAEDSLALAAAEGQRHGLPAPKQAILLRNVAEAQRKQGKLAEAEQSARQAVALLPDSACLDVLADVYRDRGNYPQAQAVLQESLRREESLAKPNPELLAKRRQKLALAYHEAGDHAAATVHFDHALVQHEQAFGAEHAETGRALTQSGVALRQAGHHAEAVKRLERALQIQEKTLEADSPEITESLYHLAMASEDSGHLDRAAAHYERILRLRRRQVAGNEYELAEIFFYLARVYLLLDRLTQSEEMAQSAILIMDRKPGPELASTLEILAKIYQRSDRVKEAAAAHERARSVRRSMGEDED